MDSRTRVISAICKRKIDQIPMGFWHHFDPETHASVSKSMECHINFYEKTGVDILKIMNENLFPHDVKIDKPSDFRAVKTPTAKSDFIVKQVELTKRIADKLANRVFILMTLHGTIASTWHARGGSAGYSEESGLLALYLKEDAPSMHEIFKKIQEGMNLLMEKLQDCGIDGIYYSALGGESYLFSDEEYHQHIEPYDLQMSEKMQELFDYNFFHICKDRVRLKRFQKMHADVFNWGEHLQNPSLEEGCDIFGDKAILGGMDNTAGVLFARDNEQLKEEIKSVLKRMKGRSFLLGADCTLPSDFDLSKLRLVKEYLAAEGDA